MNLNQYYYVLNVGNDTRISNSAFFKHQDLIRIGDMCAIDHGVYCTTELFLGNFIHIAPYCTIIGSSRSKLIMKDFSSLSAQCCMVCGGDGPNAIAGPAFPDDLADRITGTITIEEFANVYSNCTVLHGVTMAEGSVLAANSFLNQSTEPWTIYGGSPAKPIAKRDKENVLKTAEIFKNRHGY